MGGKRWREWLLGLVLFGVPLLFPGLVLFFQDGLLGMDRPTYHLPHQRFIHDHFLEGRIPFWNPHAFGGFPEFGNPEWAPMYPVHFIALMLGGPETMLNLKHLLHLSFLGVSFFLLLRYLRFKIWISFVLALALQQSGFPITKIALPNQGDTATWLPLMLLLSIWFSRRPSLRRGLIFGGAGGIMLSLFFPQVTFPLVLTAAVFGGARFFRFSTKPASFPKFIRGGSLLLALMELAILLLALRYPAGGENSGAVTGLGSMGMVLLVALPLAWAGWILGSRLRVDFERSTFLRWAVGFFGVWTLASFLAAPQLMLTGEFIPYSSMHGQVFHHGDFFTGRQAYGVLQEFVRQSVLAEPKESVNNMAIGPAIWALALGGVFLGLHRRRRFALLAFGGAILVGVVYMDLPVVGETFTSLPFFKKFPGLSRYLAFLNFFLFLLAAYTLAWLDGWAGRRRLRKFLLPAVALLFLCHGLFIVRHHHAYYRKVVGDKVTFPIPRPVFDKMEKILGPGERVILDGAMALSHFQTMMAGPWAQIPIIPTYGPMRLYNYDRLHAGHNRYHGAPKGNFKKDYRAHYFVPRPSPWSRAFNVRAYIFHEANAPRPLPPELRQVFRQSPWIIAADKAPFPAAWPEDDIAAESPSPLLPPGWRVEAQESSVNTWMATVFNPEAESRHLVIPVYTFPGWTARVDGKLAKIDEAHGAFQAVSVPPGQHAVELAYRPWAFFLGWGMSLLGIWTVAGFFRMGPVREKKLWGALLLTGLIPAALFAMLGYVLMPWSLWMRLGEIGITALAATLAGKVFSKKGGPEKGPS